MCHACGTPNPYPRRQLGGRARGLRCTSAAQFSPPVPFYRRRRSNRDASRCRKPLETRPRRLARRLQGDCRPPVWRAVVRPARSFFIRANCGILPLRASAGHARACGAMGGLLSAGGGFKFFLMMNGEQQAAIHQALLSVQSTVTGMTFPRCDQEDLIELIDRVEEQLHCSHPNTGLMCTFLNSIARSLRAQPEAREACLTIEQAIEAAGMPSTWQSGI